MYIGIGYDVHRFENGRPMILGGTKIEATYGLAGHSDADVLVHALMDALLGAAGLDDIGHLFPDTDARFKGASSVALLQEVVAQLAAKGFRVNNADISVIAEKPKVAPHIPQMKANLAAVLAIPAERIGIKATTNERMGFIGRGEGIAAMAVATIIIDNRNGGQS
jgi:2-C-methyl-D-erythritol 2,4-cyclodiphosphate synthase